ncbi:MAG: transporter [Acetobacteraceae bacterium]|nr:transporter [Acetobacteraceae bacterium]
MDRQHLARIAVVSLVSSVGFAGSARATGFAVREGNTDWMANAFAGETAKAYDAATAYANPAGMVRLSHSEIEQSINLISPSARFSGENSFGPGLTTPGTSGGNAAQFAAIPTLYGVWSYRPDLKFGLSVDTPFGLRAAYPSDWVGRYQSLVSGVTNINVSLSAAYAINEHLSIGGGPVVDYFHGRLTQAINTGPTAAITGDPTADVHGADVGFGFNLGAMYQFNDSLRLGVDYRSRIQHNLDATQSIFVPGQLSALNPAVAGALQALGGTVTTKITLPDNIAADLYWQINPAWAVMGGVQWTHWSLFKSVTIVPQNGGPLEQTPENWRNTWLLGVGVNWQVLPKLLLQTGFSWDQSPITKSTRTTRIPDADRYTLGVGAQYQLLPATTLQVAYAHGFVAAAPIRNSASSTAGVIDGSYEIHANTLSLGLKMRF